MAIPDTAGGGARPRIVCGNARGLSQAACARGHVSRLLLRAAAGPVGWYAPGVDARGRNRSRHDRPVRARRHALHGEIPVGAADRRARRAGAVAAIGPATRLAAPVAVSAHRRDRVSRRLRPGGLAAHCCCRRPHGRHGVGDAGYRRRCFSRGKPERERAGGRDGLLCRRLPHRHARFDGGRPVPGERFREFCRLRPPRRVERRLYRDGGARAGRYRNDAHRPGAGKVRASRRCPCAGRTR